MWPFNEAARARGRRATPKARLALEALEDRTVPALYTWTGLGATANWSDANNWDTHNAPNYFDDLVFPSGAAQTTSTNDIAYQFRSLTFQGAGYNIGGTVQVSGGVTGALKLNGNTVQFAHLETGYNGSTFDLGAGTLKVGNADNFTIDASIQGTGSLVKTGTGTLTLKGDQSYTGATVVVDGYLDASNANLSSATAVQLTGAASRFYVKGGQTLASLSGVAGSTVYTFDQLTVGNSTSTTFAGSFSGAGSAHLIKVGTGALLLPSPESGDASGLQGSISVNAGTLGWTGLEKALSGTEVASGARLSGAGTLIGSLTADSGSTFAVGGTRVAALSVNDDVNLAGANFEVQLNGTTAGTSYDQLHMGPDATYGGGSGALNLTGTNLKLSLGFTPAVGQKFTIIARDAGAPTVTGAFTQGSSITVNGTRFGISYAGPNGSVVLTCTAIPINHAPVNKVPTPRTMYRNGTLTVATGVTDPDAGTQKVRVKLTSSTGTVKIPTATGLTISGNGTAALTVTGALSALKSPLAHLAYKPAKGFVGTATLTMSTSDLGHTGAGGAKTDTDKVKVTVKDRAPIRSSVFAKATAYAAHRNTTLKVSIAGGLRRAFKDPDGDTLTIQLVSKPLRGTLTLKSDGSFTYVPLKNFRGKVTFTIKASDGKLASSVAMVTITVA